MAVSNNHPTVVALKSAPPQRPASALSAETVRAWFLEAGADDVGFVSIDRPEVADQRADILQAFPATRTLVSFVCRMNREPIRSTQRSLANLEFHSTGDHTNDVARTMVRRFESMGVGAVNPSMGFPMEMSRFPGKVWIVSHKPVAVAAGLGRMGIHRNVIHPRFGSFILLGTVLVAADLDQDSQPIEYNPCVDCKLCVAACPVGAIASNGSFNFASCFTHNYREFMSGFTDWVEGLADSRSAVQYRQRTTDAETASMWQSLAFGPNYKAAYCLSVCPAGEDVLGPFLEARSDFLEANVRPLQKKIEPLYVIPGSDAETHAKKRFPHKSIHHVGSVLRPTTIRGFIESMQHVFQAGQSAGLRATYHFRFTGEQADECTVIIKDQTIEVHRGNVGQCDLQITADSRAWLRFLRKEANIVWLLLSRQIRLRGRFRLLPAFGRCFP